MKKKTSVTVTDFLYMERRVIALELLVRQLKLASLSPRIAMLEARAIKPDPDIMVLLANRYADRLYDDTKTSSNQCFGGERP